MNLEVPNNQVEQNPEQEFTAELNEMKMLLETSPAVQILKKVDAFLGRVPVQKRASLQEDIDSFKLGIYKHPDVKIYNSIVSELKFLAEKNKKQS